MSGPQSQKLLDLLDLYISCLAIKNEPPIKLALPALRFLNSFESKIHQSEGQDLYNYLNTQYAARGSCGPSASENTGSAPCDRQPRKALMCARWMDGMFPMHQHFRVLNVRWSLIFCTRCTKVQEKNYRTKAIHPRTNDLDKYLSSLTLQIWILHS